MLTTPQRRRTDPTRTLTLRTRYVRAMRRRFGVLRQNVRESMHVRDGFGLRPGPRVFQAAPERAWAFPTREAQIVAFLL